MEKTPFLNPADFLEDETFLISFNIALICQRICDVQTRILKKYDLTPRQSLVLAYLRNHADEKVTQKVLEDKIRALPMSKSRNLQRFFFAGAAEAEPDKQGRVLIPAHLREYAGLTKDVTVIGASVRAEIWDSERYQSSCEELTSDSIAESMDELGF